MKILKDTKCEWALRVLDKCWHTIRKTKKSCYPELESRWWIRKFPRERVTVGLVSGPVYLIIVKNYVTECNSWNVCEVAWRQSLFFTLATERSKWQKEISACDSVRKIFTHDVSNDAHCCILASYRFFFKNAAISEVNKCTIT